MVAESEHVALNPLVSPVGILSGQLRDQIDDRVLDWRASGPVRITPLPRYQPAMPAQNRARSDQPTVPDGPRQEPTQRGEQRAICPIQLRLRVRSTQDRDLVPQHQ
jgi:hypothetical protein